MNLASPSQDKPGSPVAGIILAGGASRRMGRAKALLPWGSSTLLHHLTQTLLPRVDPLIVVAESPTFIPSLPTSVQVVFDSVPHQGPLAGISNGLKHVPTDRPVFLTGCDFPFVQPSMLDFLLDRLRDADVVVPHSQGTVQPLAGLYHPRIRGKVTQLLEQGERSLRALLKQIDSRIIADTDWLQFDPSGLMLMNINTPQEYERAHEHYLDTTSSPE